MTDGWEILHYFSILLRSKGEKQASELDPPGEQVPWPSVLCDIFHLTVLFPHTLLDGTIFGYPFLKAICITFHF